MQGPGHTQKQRMYLVPIKAQIICIVRKIFFPSFDALATERNMFEGSSVNSHLLQGDPQFGRTRTQSMVGSPRYQMDPEWYIQREKICILKACRSLCCHHLSIYVSSSLFHSSLSCNPSLIYPFIWFIFVGKNIFLYS